MAAQGAEAQRHAHRADDRDRQQRLAEVGQHTALEESNPGIWLVSASSVPMLTRKKNIATKIDGRMFSA
jgi:hypothetical protein